MNKARQFSCFLCGSTDYLQRQGHARDNVNLKPLECSRCGLVQLSSLDHIEPSFYENGHMHDSQPVSVQSELAQCQEDTTRRLEQFKPVLAGKRLLDVGCGAGSFLMAAENMRKALQALNRKQVFKNIFPNTA